MKRICLTGLLLGMLSMAPATIQPSVTYYRDVLPILQSHCQSCHRPGQVAPMSFLSYKETRPWAEAMKYVVLAKTMPPWFSESPFIPTSDHFRLSLREIDTIVRWADEGAPAGNPKDAPPPLFQQETQRHSSPFLPARTRPES